jgi:hypothetical protein
VHPPQFLVTGRVTALVHTSPMVLVAPRQEQGALWSPAPPAPPAPVDGDLLVSAGQAAAIVPDAGRPATARDEVLALLRDGSSQRPRFDPGLAGGLRAWLEDAAADLVARRGEEAPPLFLGPRLLWDESVAAADPLETGADPYPSEWVRSCLVRALFAQVVTTGQVEDPLRDALDALRVDPGRSAMARHVDELPEEARAALAASLRIHIENLMNLTPRFAAGWLPRTNDRVAIPLAGGRVILNGVFDLLVGAPVPGLATLCALGLTTGGRWAQARTALHYLALLETLRSGTPPFRLALLHSAAGRYGVEDVLEEHLATIVSHVVARLSTLGAGDA